MTFLSDICGLKGENLCSALLAHLMLRSPEVRACVIRLISDRAPQGPVLVHNQIAIFCEQSTISAGADEEDCEPRRGRLDLAIETDDTVIGIESKFNAPFQEGQPAGYLALLQERATGLSKIRSTEFSHVLTVLAPARRETEVLDRLAEQKLDDTSFLAWEDLLAALADLEISSPVDLFLVREMKTYAENQMGSVQDLRRLLPHLQRRWVPRGSSIHRDFMNTFLWSLLDEQIKSSGAYRCAYGISYYGYYLRPRSIHEVDNLWIGFHEIRDPPGGAALTVCVLTGDGLELPSGPYLKAVVRQDWADYGWSCADITFDSSAKWQDVKTWSHAVQPINDLIGRIAKG